MNLHLLRDVFGKEATLGVLTIDGKPFGYVCEDQDRGLDATMPLAEIKAKKVHGETAIPAGSYKVGIRYSPKHGKDVLYLQDVPGFQFIEIHVGNKEADTDGCQLIGLYRDTATMQVQKSTPAVAWLENHVMPLVRAGTPVTYTIERAPGHPSLPVG